MSHSKPISRTRVGIDLVRLSETRRSLDCFGERFLRRIFTERELHDCFGTVAARNGSASSQPLPLARLSARFAAKEATVKVLRPQGPPHEGWVDWRSIEVRRTPAGWSELHLTDDARALAARSSLTDFSLSMSHEGDYATAVVVATADDPGSTTT